MIFGKSNLGRHQFYKMPFQTWINSNTSKNRRSFDKKSSAEMDPRLKHPFTCLVAGPTGCGKSTLVKQWIEQKEQLMDPVPEQVIWYYGEWQEMYEKMPGVEFVEGLPDINTLDPKKKKLIILDDLMADTDTSVTALFTKGSHHHNLSVVHLVQNVFDKKQRTLSLNAHYLVLFKNPRDVSQITHLAKQMYPGHIKFLQEVFKDATSQPYGYLLVDLKQETPEHLRLRSHMLPQETSFVYLRKQ